MSTVYESLLPKLIAILEVTQQAADGVPTQQVKQTLVLAVCAQRKNNLSRSLWLQTNDFRDTLKEAKEMATTLPGGELSVKEQDEVIAMLERLKERKQYVLFAF